MQRNASIKSWLLPALLFLASCFTQVVAASTNAQLSTLAESAQWHSLLHVQDGEPQIRDPRFLLSANDFSPVTELQQTLSYLTQQPQEAICRFPGRAMFLRQQLKAVAATLPDPTKDASHCETLTSFVELVPFDKVELLFASEILSSATSMMGHDFLRVSGINRNGNSVSHSLSFLAEITSSNPFNMLYDGLIGGMPGFVLVRPYRTDRNRYLNVEGRNLWHYTLSLDDTQRALLRYHVWELRDLDIRYLFQSYNCSTLIYDLLALVYPRISADKPYFVSPLDVAKTLSEHELVTKQQVELAPRWQAAMLKDTLGQPLLATLDDALQKDAWPDLTTLAENERALALHYLQSQTFSANPSVISPSSPLEKQLLLPENEPGILDLSNYKSPTRTQQDSSLSVEWQSASDSLLLRYLPAARYLRGDNRQYMAESELKILSSAIAYRPKTNNWRLDELTLYGFTSLTDTMNTGDWSTRFYLGYQTQQDVKSGELGIGQLSFGIGKSARIHTDILVYTMLDIGLSTSATQDGVFAQPELGIIINTLGHSKLNLTYKYNLGQFSESQHQSAMELSWFGVEQQTWYFRFDHINSDSGSAHNVSFGVDWHF